MTIITPTAHKGLLIMTIDPDRYTHDSIDAKAVSELREALDLTQVELGRQLGLSIQQHATTGADRCRAVESYEHGDRTPQPEICERMQRLAKLVAGGDDDG